LGYQWSARDEGKILEPIRNKGEADSMFFLETATAVDEFFCFLRELGVWQELEELVLPGQKRKSVSSSLWIRFMRCTNRGDLLGVSYIKTPETPDLP
jgi:hypothetical protein